MIELKTDIHIKFNEINTKYENITTFEIPPHSRTLKITTDELTLVNNAPKRLISTYNRYTHLPYTQFYFHNQYAVFSTQSHTSILKPNTNLLIPLWSYNLIALSEICWGKTKTLKHQTYQELMNTFWNSKFDLLSPFIQPSPITITKIHE